MRPPQDPEVVRKAKEQEWYIDFDDVNPQAREILEKYSGIPPDDVVAHVKDIVRRPYSMLTPLPSHSPAKFANHSV